MAGPSDLDGRTLAVHAGLAPDPVTGAIAPNVAMAINYAARPGEAGFSANDNPDLTALPYLYARWTNPTVRQLERRLAALEGADDGMATATGMAAAAALFFGTLRRGDHLVVSDVCYPGVRELASEVLPELGIEATPVNLSDLAAVWSALRPNTRLIHAETPCNPLLRLTDLRAIAEIANAAGALLSVDSTLATPVATQPIALGADFVIHSLTKYINGHGDALGGILLGRKDRIEAIRRRVGVRLGATLSAQNAWLILRGADTLYPRMDASARTAQALAAQLEAHPAVARVVYPGLPSHPQADLARRQMRNFGAVLTFQTRADPDRVASAMAGGGLRLVHYAVSLGHQRSIVVLMKTGDLMQSTYRLAGADLADYRRYAGDGVFRLSVGLESADDLLADLCPLLDRFR
ncbi:MAG TPA: PLP-dependent aspartate aminotransferase family protein [Microvirga sp.]|nr:PLP-dependent aspartate aminotransferase family protein [Microvirga sp.]